MKEFYNVIMNLVVDRDFRFKEILGGRGRLLNIFYVNNYYII